jgi:hypothetical protein
MPISLLISYIGMKSMTVSDAVLNCKPFGTGIVIWAALVVPVAWHNVIPAQWMGIALNVHLILKSHCWQQILIIFASGTQLWVVWYRYHEHWQLECTCNKIRKKWRKLPKFCFSKCPFLNSFHTLA